MIVSQISRIPLILASFKWPRLADYFIHSMTLHWTILSMIPTDKGVVFSDTIVVLMAFMTCLILFVEYKPAVIVSMIYTAIVILVIDPAIYQQEYNSRMVIGKLMHVFWVGLMITIFACFLTMILILQRQLIGQANDYFSLLSMMNSGLLVISNKSQWKIKFANNLAKGIFRRLSFVSLDSLGQ